MADKVSNREITSTWERPWNMKKFDDLYNRDERFFSILLKGFLSWMNRHIVLYDESINHYIFNTGSSYLYMESDGYKFSMSETSGEDQIYMKMPRCIINLEDISIPLEELTSPYVRGVYERRDGTEMKGYNAQMRRLPIEMSLSANYVLSTFNEGLVLLQEIIDSLTFQKYFNIVYLGQVIQCSIEIDSNYKIEFNKLDMTSTDTNQKNINLNFKLCSNYPLIDTSTECENKDVITTFVTNVDIYNERISKERDNVTQELNDFGRATREGMIIDYFKSEKNPRELKTNVEEN